MFAALRVFITASRSAMVSGAAVISPSVDSGRLGRISGWMFQRLSSAAIRSLSLGLGWVSQRRALGVDLAKVWLVSAQTKESAAESTPLKVTGVLSFFSMSFSSRFLNAGVACVFARPGGADG